MLLYKYFDKITEFQIIKNYNNEDVDIAKLYAADERQMAWRILNMLMKDVRGKIMEPQKKTDESRLIPSEIVSQLKRKYSCKIY